MSLFGLDYLDHFGLDSLGIVLVLIMATMVAIMAVHAGDERHFSLIGKLLLFAVFFGLFIIFSIGASNEAWIGISHATQWITQRK